MIGEDRPHVLIVKAIAPGVLPLLEKDYRLHHLPSGPERRAFLRRVGLGIRGLVTDSGVGFDRDLLDALPNLEIAVVSGSHTDRADVAAARQRGIAVGCTPRASAKSVADLTFGQVLGLFRRVAAADRYVRGGQWQGSGPYPLTVQATGKRLGICGLGQVGREVVRRAVPFRMTVAYHGPRPKEDVPYPFHGDLASLAADVDVLVCTCPGGPGTRGLIGAGVLEALGREGYLVNVARGAVDEEALAAALEGGVIAGAALDVDDWEAEVSALLVNMENVILLPHLGSGAEETRQRQVDLTIANLAAYFAGEPLPTPVPEG